MTLPRISRRAAAAAALAGLWACSGSTQPPGSGPTASLTLSPSPASVMNDGTFSTITATAVTAAGTPGTGSVTFSTAYGSLTDPVSGAAATTVTLAADGTARIRYSCNIGFDPRCVAGPVFVSAVWTSASKTAQITLTAPGGIGGTPPPPPPPGGGTPPPPMSPPGAPASIVATASTPFALGLKGSGIQESGITTFKVTDAVGVPVPNVAVTFALRAPLLGIALARTTANTDGNGIVQAAYTSGTEVGVTAITASITGASTAQAVAVRGAKPSANGFYFTCARVNLPVYTTTSRFESTTCTVRLSDRFGNRIGVPTPVRFATEAGSISATALTKGFDFSNPNDPNEGTATVTFSSDMGNGIWPADVAPFAADPAQYPWPRLAEPSVANGALTRNPRDQFVTIIAMTQGEEAFVDANHNGLLDNNEVFYDLGDPFIDANDNNVYDQIYTGGPWERSFCGLNPDCSIYHGPNGVWDSSTVIWVPTWVVFTGCGLPRTRAAGAPAPASDFVPSCVPRGGSTFSDIYIYDDFLNGSASNTSYAVQLASVATDLALTVKKIGFFSELDSWGAMGLLGFNFDYRPVSTTGGACVAPAAPTAPTACVMRLLFRDFDTGFRGTVQVSSPAGGTSTCPSTSVFKTSVQASCEHATIAVGLQSGTYAP